MHALREAVGLLHRTAFPSTAGTQPAGAQDPLSVAALTLSALASRVAEVGALMLSLAVATRGLRCGCPGAMLLLLRCSPHCSDTQLRYLGLSPQYLKSGCATGARQAAWCLDLHLKSR
jgi:hypothetical protein